MTWLALPLALSSIGFGTVAIGWLGPVTWYERRQVLIDRIERTVLGVCALLAALATGLVL